MAQIYFHNSRHFICIWAETNSSVEGSGTVDLLEKALWGGVILAFLIALVFFTHIVDSHEKTDRGCKNRQTSGGEERRGKGGG